MTPENNWSSKKYVQDLSDLIQDVFIDIFSKSKQVHHYIVKLSLRLTDWRITSNFDVTLSGCDRLLCLVI